LEQLDVSRNNIANIAPGTFLGLSHLRELDLSVNALRTVSFHTMQLRPPELQQFTVDRPVKRTAVCMVSLSYQEGDKMVLHVEILSQYLLQETNKNHENSHYASVKHILNKSQVLSY
jgi:hypothetical protein